MPSWFDEIVAGLILALVTGISFLFTKVIKLEKNDTKLTNLELEKERIDKKFETKYEALDKKIEEKFNSILEKIDNMVDGDETQKQNKQRSCDVHTNALNNIAMKVNNHDMFFEAMERAITDFAEIKTKVAVMANSLDGVQKALLDVVRENKDIFKILQKHELRIQSLEDRSESKNISEKKPTRAPKQ